MDDLIADEYVPPPAGGARRSGGSRLKERNELPLVFFIYQKELRLVQGAAICHKASVIRGDNTTVWWRFSRPVRLVEPVHVDRTLTKYYGLVFALKPAAETAIRLSPVTAGGSLATHFPEFETRIWRCFLLTAVQVETVLGGLTASTLIMTPYRHVQAAGISVGEVDVEPSVQSEQELGDEAAELDGDGPPAAPADVHDSPMIAGVAAAEHHMRDSYKVQRGSVAHRYAPSAMLSYLELAANLRPTAKIGDALAASAEIFFGAPAVGFKKKLRDGVVPLPSLNTMKIARLKLDLLSMIWQQKLFVRFDYLIYSLIDSSPQLGYNFLVVIEDQVRVPWAATWDLAKRMALILNEHWESVLQPFSSLGLGRASTLNKTIVTSNVLIMNAEKIADFDRRRKSQRGFCTDHGVEHQIGRMPLGVAPMKVEGSDNPAEFLYPDSVSVIDLLHTLWGGYETVCKGDQLFSKFIDVLQPLVNFMSDTQCMRKFRAECCDDQARHVFKTKAVVHSDWRWETMTHALDIQVPVHDEFRNRFNEAQLLQSESASKILQSSIIKNAKLALDKMPGIEFKSVAEYVRVIGKVVDSWTGQLEVCDCHVDLWEKDRSWRKRRRLLEDAIGREQCVWQGRRLSWFIAIGYDLLLKAIADATSERLQELLASADVELRGRIAAGFEEIRVSLLAIYKDKCEYLFHGICLAVGAFYVTMGGTAERSRELLARLINEVEAAVASGQSAKLDNVTRKLFLPGAKVRMAADAYISDTTKDLGDFPVLYIAIQEYALLPGVARRVEKANALITRAGSYRFGIGLPYLCAVIREHKCLDNLNASTEFYQFCLQSYNSRSLLNRLLHLRVSPEDLKNLSFNAKLALVYQCSLEGEYATHSAEKETGNTFNAIVPCLKPTHEKYSDQVQACINFIKGMFERGAYYSMPRDLFRGCVASTFTLTPGRFDNCVQILLDATFQPDVNVVLTDEMVSFRITTSTPENRKTRRMPYLGDSRTQLECIVCQTERADAFGASAFAVAPSDLQSGMETLDCLGLVENFARFARETFRWNRGGVRAVPVIRPVPPRPLAVLDDLGLPPIIATEYQPVSDAAASSSTAAPCDIVAPMQGDTQRQVNNFVLRGHFAGKSSVRFVDTDMTSYQVDELASQGVLQVVQDDLLETQLALRSEGVAWSPAVQLDRPLPICRVRRKVKDILKHTKLELLVWLRHEGWSNGAGDPLKPNSPLECRLSLKPPLSYLAAMLSSRGIFSKHVPEIMHDQADYYYRCLLKLSAEELQSLVPVIAGKRMIG